MLPRDGRVRIPRRPTKKLWARTMRTRAGRARKVKGRTGKEGQGQDGQGRVKTCFGLDSQDWSMARTVHGQDGQGTRRAGQENAGCQLIQVSPGLDARKQNGIAQSDVILSGHFGLQTAQSG